jgi:DNA-binding protein HU-beta
MHKPELITAVAADTGFSKVQVERTLNSIIYATKEAVSKGETVRIADLFNLSVERREAKAGRNPMTGEVLQIAAKNAVKIKPAKALVDAANGR